MTLPRPILRLGWACHRALHRLTGGRLSTEAPSPNHVGTLFLLSRGRKSGKIRRNGLFYIEDGPAFVVVASNAGENVDPSWWRNLQVNPDAEVEIGARNVPVRARAASAEEESRLVPELDKGYSGYARYRRQSLRHIPVVILEPRPD